MHTISRICNAQFPLTSIFLELFLELLELALDLVPDRPLTASVLVAVPSIVTSAARLLGVVVAATASAAFGRVEFSGPLRIILLVGRPFVASPSSGPAVPFLGRSRDLVFALTPSAAGRPVRVAVRARVVARGLLEVGRVPDLVGTEATFAPRSGRRA